MGSGEEPGAPVEGAAFDAGGFWHDDERGEVAVTGAEPVAGPGAGGGEAGAGVAGVHLVHRRGVGVGFGVAGFDEGDVVDAGGEVGQGRGDPGAGFPVLPELVGGFHAGAGAAKERVDPGERLAVVFCQGWFWIEEVEPGGAAFHE